MPDFPPPPTPPKIKAVLFTGDGSTDRVISLGFRPDAFWIFPKSHGEDHVRGADVEERTPHRTDPVLMDTTQDYLTSVGVNVGKIQWFSGEGNVNNVRYVLIGISE
jgi:hypothetical protein